MIEVMKLGLSEEEDAWLINLKVPLKQMSAAEVREKVVAPFLREIDRINRPSEEFRAPSCPRCGSVKNQAIERRPDGDAKCGDCGHRGKYSSWVSMVVSEGAG